MKDVNIISDFMGNQLQALIFYIILAKFFPKNQFGTSKALDFSNVSVNCCCVFKVIKLITT